MEEVGTIIISGSLEDTGVILDINDYFYKLFKYKNKEDLLKNSVNKIIPSFLAQYHDEYIHRYLNTSEGHVINTLRIVFGLNNNGFIFPVMMFIKLIPYLDKGVRFIGLLKDVDNDNGIYKIGDKNISKALSFIISDKDGVISNISKHVYFSIKLNRL